MPSVVLYANPRVTKKQVDRAAAAYQSAVAQWGPNNLATVRALGDWQTLQNAYEQQTGKRMYGMGKNPPGQVMSNRVYAIEYQHAEDGKNYRHDFDRPVRIVVQPNGDVLLCRVYKSDGPVTEEF